MHNRLYKFIMHNNKPLRKQNRLNNIILNIHKMKKGHVKKYHIINSDEIQIISEYCKNNKIIHEVLHEENNNDKRNRYVRVWKGYNPKFDSSIPYEEQIVKYFLHDGTASYKSLE